MKIKYFLLVFVLMPFLVSCGSQKKVVKYKPKYVKVNPVYKNLPSVNQVSHVKKLEVNGRHLNKERLDYIRKYAPIAVKEMHDYHIPASITLAQGILESGSGKSKLARKSNNHFSIKCHKGWTGARVYHDDDRRGECFRKYTYVESSYEDHSKFLTTRNRYASLFRLQKSNYKAWAKGLKKAGYATDRKYPQKLIKIIEDYHLYEFDKFKKRKTLYAKQRYKKKKGTPQKKYKVKQGDTLYNLSKRFGISVHQLKKLNRLKNNNLEIGQELILK